MKSLRADSGRATSSGYTQEELLFNQECHAKRVLAAHKRKPEQPARRSLFWRMALYWQDGLAHQSLVNGVRALATLADRPDDKRLATPHVTSGPDFVMAGFVG